MVLKIPALLEALLSSLFSLLFKLAALPRFPPQPMIFCLLEKREVSVTLRSASLPVEMSHQQQPMKRIVLQAVLHTYCRPRPLCCLR